MKTVNITPQIIKSVQVAAKAAINYERLTGRKLGITGEVAEVLVCKKLGLKLLEDPLSAGYDAVDRKNKKYQIKSKRSNRFYGRIGRFSEHKFDFCILVLLDEKYEIEEIYKLPFKIVESIIILHKRRSPPVRSLRIKKFLVRHSSK